MKSNLLSQPITSNEELDAIREQIPSFLTAKRLVHTVAVEEQALSMARILLPYSGIGLEFLPDISAAALLHDITKKRTDSEQDALCRRYGIETCYTQKGSGALLHSKTAAYIAREMFGINDRVFGAIYYHTTGCEDMNIFEKIVFLADFIEPTRKHSVCQEVRSDFYTLLDTEKNKVKALDKAIIEAIDRTIIHLVETENTIDVQTIMARNFLMSQLQKQQITKGHAK